MTSRPLLVLAAVFAIALVSPYWLPNFKRMSDATRAFVVRVLTPAKPHTEPIDVKAAAKLDEDIDFRIASQGKTEKGWRQFLAAHPNGAHAADAQAQLDAIAPAPPKPALSPRPRPKPAPPDVAVFSPVVRVINAPPEAPPNDVFAVLERPRTPETRIIETTVVKSRDPPTRYVHDQRRRHYRPRPRPSPWPFLAWFGPRAPGSARER